MIKIYLQTEEPGCSPQNGIAPTNAWFSPLLTGWTNGHFHNGNLLFEEPKQPTIMAMMADERGRRLNAALEAKEFMSQTNIWPDGIRYLWTDSHGVCNLLSLYYETGDSSFLKQAEDMVNKVYDVLGRKRGLRIGEEPDRDGQYYHYLTKWMYALNEFGKIKPEYHSRAVSLIKDIHPAFVIKGRGVIWKMLEDLSGPYPGYGLGGLDFYDGYVIYKLIDESALSSEIGDMYTLIQKDYHKFSCTQDLGLGEVLWMTHFFPDESWAQLLRQRAEKQLNEMWVSNKNETYFCRQPSLRKTKFAFTNYGVSVGCQSVGIWPERVAQLNEFFGSYKSNDEYDFNSITHVMRCSSLFPGVFLRNFERKPR